jgi:hypothetical protein
VETIADAYRENREIVISDAKQFTKDTDNFVCVLRIDHDRAMLESLTSRGLIEDRAGALSLSDEGRAFMRDFGVSTDDLDRGRRPLCRACLDWSERRNHLAGALGKALLEQLFTRGWARRVAGARVVVFSAPGLAAFERTLAA